MGLDEELEKAKKKLKENPRLGREAYEGAMAELKERLGNKEFKKFMEEIDLDNDSSKLNKWLRFLESLEGQGVRLCPDCMAMACKNFFEVCK